MPNIHPERCDRCEKCLHICAQELFNQDNPALAALKITEIDGKTAIIGCMECGKCAELCPSGAIERDFRGIYIINLEKCTGCGTCIDVCPNGLIHSFNGKPQKCKKCGKCVMNCPNSVFTH